MAPETVIGRRRLAILKGLVASSPRSSTVADVSGRLGLLSPTARVHLQALEDLGLVVRVNYRRWRIIAGFTFRGFDGTRLDPKEDPHVVNR